MPFLLEIPVLHTDLSDSRKYILDPFVVQEVPFLLHQDQNAVVV
jgi:hypothetical protein